MTNYQTIYQELCHQMDSQNIYSNMKALVLRQYPDETFPQNMDFFDIKQLPIPTELGDNELLIKVIYVSIDPVMRVWLSGAKTYIDAVQINQVMPSFGIGYCIASNAKKWKKDDIVFGVLDCADYCVRNAKKVFKLPPAFQKDDPIFPLIFSVYGVTGLTAYNGLKQIPESNLPTADKKKTFLVSSAAGSTGSYAIQIAKYKGYRTVGIVSSSDKKDFILGLGADACVAYNEAKDENNDIDTDKLTQLIKLAAPEGIDVYFDNAGEEVLDAVLPTMNNYGYMILCGATATYNSWKNRGGLKNVHHLITKRVKTEGILYYGQRKKMVEAFFEMVELVNGGHVKHLEEFLVGIDKFVYGLQRVFLGQNLGKIIVKLDDSVQLPKY